MRLMRTYDLFDHGSGGRLHTHVLIDLSWVRPVPGKKIQKTTSPVHRQLRRQEQLCSQRLMWLDNILAPLAARTG